MDILPSLIMSTIYLLPFFISPSVVFTNPVEQNINILINNTASIESKRINVLEYNIDDIPFMKENMRGTNQWDDLIIKVGNEEGVSPILLKVLMCVESGGEQKSINYNKNGTKDTGLLQINSGFGKQFDYNRMLIDPEYAIRSGAKVVKGKAIYIKQLKKELTVFNLMHFYNGYNNVGRKYAERSYKIYKCFKYKDDLVLQ